MYLNTTVKIPEMKGKIISKKKGGTTYILYQYGSEYNPDKEYAVPLRTIVGKVSPSDATLMFPNEKFHVYFPDAQLPDLLRAVSGKRRAVRLLLPEIPPG